MDLDEAASLELESSDRLSEYEINWLAEGKVTPVKDQLECGSCWAFAASTVLESKVAIEENTTPVRLSEQ